MFKKILKRPSLIIAVCALVTVFFSLQLPKLKIENDLKEWLDHKNISYIRFHETNRTFGSTNAIGVSLEDPDGNIFTSENLSVLKNISDEIEGLHNVQNVDSLTSIDYVCSEDDSIVAAQLISSDLFTEDESGRQFFSGTQKDIDEIKLKIKSWNEMYERFIVSENNDAAQVMITFDADVTEDDGTVHPITTAERETLLRSVEDVVERNTKGTKLAYRFYGDPVTSDSAKEFMLSDLVCLIPLVVLVVLISLFLSFKTLSGTLLPCITVVMASIWTCGFMALLNVKFSILSSVIPVVLVAIGSAYGIHVLTHYYAELKKVPGDITREKHIEIIQNGVKEVFVPVMLAGFTTIVGFISLVTSPIEPLHSFAVFNSLGVFISLVLSITFIPAMLLIKKTDKIKARAHAPKIVKEIKNKAHIGNKKEGLFYRTFSFFAGSKIRLCVSTLLVVCCSVFFMRYLVVDTALINYFPKSSELRKDVDYVNDKFCGSNSLYMIITSPAYVENPAQENQPADDSFTADFALTDFGDENFEEVSGESFAEGFEENSDFCFGDDDFDSFGSEWNTEEVQVSQPSLPDMTNPEILIAVDSYSKYIQEKYDVIGKVVSFPTFIKRMNQVFNSSDFDDPVYYEIPNSKEKYPEVENFSELISQYLMLIGGDTTERFVLPKGSFNPTQSRVQIQLTSFSSKETKKIIDDSKEFIKNNFPEGYTVEFTGPAEVELAMTDLIISSQLVSLLLSIVSVFVILAISFKSCLAGIVGAIPLVLTILLNYMVMSITGIKLDLITSIIASVAVGVGIDYTIHFMEGVKAERPACANIDEALRLTFAKSGKGIITNAIAVGCGFFVLVFSKFIILRYLGVLVTVVMFTSSFFAMTVIPGILKIFDPKFINTGSKK